MKTRTAPVSFLKLAEQQLRYFMAGVAAFGVFGLVAFNAGYITTTPDYELHSWYQTSENGSYHVIKKFADEASCQATQKQAGQCQSGRALMAAMYKNAPVATDKMASSLSLPH